MADLQQIFADREEVMKDKWNENRPSKLNNVTCLSRKARPSRVSIAADKEKKLKELAQECISPSQRYSNGETIFHLLARENQAATITDLLQKGHQLDKDDQGIFPWQIAAACGNIEALESFYKENPLQISESCDHFKFTILHTAVLGTGNTTKQINMIEYIINNIKEIDINQTDIYGRTPLFCAGQYRKPQLGKVLLSLGADPEISTSFNSKVLGMAATGCPDLTVSLMDWALQKEKEDPDRSVMTQGDVNIIYYAKVDDRVMLHPYIRHIIGDINKGKSFDLQLMALLGYIVGTIFVNGLCLTNEMEAMTIIDGSMQIGMEQVLYMVACLWTIALIAVDFYQGKMIMKSIQRLKTTKENIKSVSGYQSTAYHTDLSADKTITLKRSKSIVRAMTKNIIFESVELMICFLGKVMVLACQFMSNESKQGDIFRRDYLLSFALILIWWELYRKFAWLTIMPEYFIIFGLVIQRCMVAILEIIMVAVILATPFILILIKISIIERMAIYKPSDEDSNIGQKILFAIGHMFRLLTLDNYHDYEFEDSHSVFLSFFYPLAMSIFSLVILNMCIAKLSIEYKDIIDNAQYEVNRQRLYIKVEWDSETIKAKHAIKSLNGEKIKTWLCCKKLYS